MKSSIFQKQLRAFMIILVGSFLILGFMLTLFFSSYLHRDKMKVMEEQANRVASIYAKRFKFTPLFGQEDLKKELDAELQSMLIYKNVHVFITDELLRVQSYSSDIGHFENLQVLYPELLPVVEGKTVHTIGNLNGLFQTREMTVGYPIIHNGIVRGAAFVSTPLDDIKSTLSGLLRILSATSLVSVFTAFIFVYFTSSKITQPLTRIGEAASEIAAGNFDKRIDIDSKDEIGQLADSFNHMAKSLHEIEQDRREFISNLSHDIRSPLTSIRGFLEAILDGTIEPADQAYYLEIVLEETDRISQLANDTLELSKLENAQGLQPSIFDINELIRRNLMMLDNRISDKNLDVHLLLADEMNYVEADEEKIKRVISNLLDNGVKFSNPNTTLTIETTKRPNSYLSLSINNVGLLIPDDEINKIFDRFYKADMSRGQDKRGTGLGLAIVREFVKAHGSEIHVTSSESEGTTFTFSLPMAEQKD